MANADDMASAKPIYLEDKKTRQRESRRQKEQDVRHESRGGFVLEGGRGSRECIACALETWKDKTYLSSSMTM